MQLVHINLNKLLALFIHWLVDMITYLEFKLMELDFFETYLAFLNKLLREQKGKGPSVIVSNVVSQCPILVLMIKENIVKEDLEKDLLRDPIQLFKTKCIKNKILRKQKP